MSNLTQFLNLRRDPYLKGTLKRQVFTASGTFTVPAGVSVVFVSGCGGGGSGGAAIRREASLTATAHNHANGGAAGANVLRLPLGVTPGAAIPVTVGAGGASVAQTLGSGNSSSGSRTAGNAGGASSFLGLSLPGGAGGGVSASSAGATVAAPGIPLLDGAALTGETATGILPTGGGSTVANSTTGGPNSPDCVLTEEFRASFDDGLPLLGVLSRSSSVRARTLPVVTVTGGVGSGAPLTSVYSSFTLYIAASGGGNCLFGAGGIGRASTTVGVTLSLTGDNGSGYGAGGGAANFGNSNSTAAQRSYVVSATSGAGAPGLIVVEWFE